MAYALQAVAAAVLFALTAISIEGDTASGAELWVFHLLNDLPGWLFYVVWLPMQGGNMVVIPLVAVGLMFRRMWWLAAAVLVVGGLKLWLARVIKDLVVRHRPAVFVDDLTLRGGAPATGQAFVSGHAIIAVAVAVILHPYLPRAWRIVVWTVAALVCFGRVYTGAHLPLDVVGGAAVGWALGALVHVALGRRKDFKHSARR